MSTENMFENLVAQQESGTTPESSGSSLSADRLWESESAPVVQEPKAAPEVKEEKKAVEVKAEEPVVEEKVEEIKETSIEEKMLQESLKSDEEKQAELAPSSKNIKIKVGKEYQEIPEDATIKMKINGKYEVKSIAEIRDLASANVAIEQKFEEIRKEKELVKQEKSVNSQSKNQQLESTKRIANAFSRSTTSGIVQMAEEAGVENVVEYAENIKAKFKQEILEEMNMSEAELALKQREDRLKVQEESLDLKRRSKEETETIEKLTIETKSVMEALKLNVDEFEQGYQSLVKNHKSLDQSQITPELVGQWIQLERRGNFIMDHLSEIKPELANNYDLIADITNKSLEFKLSDETVAKLLTQQYGKRVLDKDVIAINEKLKDNTNHKQVSKSEVEESKPVTKSKVANLNNLWD